jgi:ABC-type branched-subunit amino acid transport system substrate-binding protein
VLVSATDHDSRHMTRALRQSLARLQMGPRFQFELREATPEELDALSQRILDAGPGGVAVVANAAETATIMNRLRGAGFRGSLFGGPSVASAAFQQTFQQALPGTKGRIVYPLLADPAALAPGDSRAEISPGARCMVDAVQLAIAAIRQAGLNRARIRDAVVELSPYRGVSGVIRWDRLGSNTRSVSLAEVDGLPHALSGD